MRISDWSSDVCSSDLLARFSRADISVAVSIPNGLITPVIVDAGGRSLSAIATAMKDLAARAREGKLQPHEYQGGTASLSNLRSEEQTSELQSLMRISYAVFCLKKKTKQHNTEP